MGELELEARGFIGLLPLIWCVYVRVLYEIGTYILPGRR